MNFRAIDHRDAYDAAPWLTSFILRLTNGTPTVLPIIHVRSARRMFPELIHRIQNFAPGATVALPLGTVHDVGFYEIAAFNAKGHMIARLPRGTGAIAPGEPGAQLPLRINSHTDELTITQADVLDAQESYIVKIRNGTPDTWDEVAISYADGLTGMSATYASSPVSPKGEATFNLGPAGAMDGYVFSIFVNGLRAELDGDGSLQFPAHGLMTAERSSALRGETHPTLDVWQIGDDI